LLNFWCKLKIYFTFDHRISYFHSTFNNYTLYIFIVVCKFSQYLTLEKSSTSRIACRCPTFYKSVWRPFQIRMCILFWKIITFPLFKILKNSYPIEKMSVNSLANWVAFVSLRLFVILLNSDDIVRTYLNISFLLPNPLRSKQLIVSLLHWHWAN